MTYPTAERITWALGLLIGSMLFLAAVGQCGHPPPAHAATAVASPWDLWGTAPPSLLARAYTATAPVHGIAVGALLLHVVARLLASARRRWGRWRRGWFGTAAATLYTCATIAGGALVLGAGMNGALAAIGAAMAVGGALAADPDTARIRPLSPPARATDGAVPS